MNKIFIKRLLSILVCVGMLLAFALVTNAESLYPGDSRYVDNKTIVFSQGNQYSYSVSYVHFDGLAVGAFMPGLDVLATRNRSEKIFSINSYQYTGTYSVPGAGSYAFDFVNHSAKHVSINYEIHV